MIKESISVRLNCSFYFWVFNFQKQDKKLQLWCKLIFDCTLCLFCCLLWSHYTEQNKWYVKLNTTLSCAQLKKHRIANDSLQTFNNRPTANSFLWKLSTQKLQNPKPGANEYLEAVLSVDQSSIQIVNNKNTLHIITATVVVWILLAFSCAKSVVACNWTVPRKARLPAQSPELDQSEQGSLVLPWWACKGIRGKPRQPL